MKRYIHASTSFDPEIVRTTNGRSYLLFDKEIRDRTGINMYVGEEGGNEFLQELCYNKHGGDYISDGLELNVVKKYFDINNIDKGELIGFIRFSDVLDTDDYGVIIKMPSGNLMFEPGSSL